MRRSDGLKLSCASEPLSIFLMLTDVPSLFGENIDGMPVVDNAYFSSMFLAVLGRARLGLPGLFK